MRFYKSPTQARLWWTSAGGPKESMWRCTPGDYLRAIPSSSEDWLQVHMQGRSLSIGGPGRKQAGAVCQETERWGGPGHRREQWHLERVEVGYMKVKGRGSGSTFPEPAVVFHIAEAKGKCSSNSFGIKLKIYLNIKRGFWARVLVLVTIRSMHVSLVKSLTFFLINELVNNGWALSFLNWCETT